MTRHENEAGRWRAAGRRVAARVNLGWCLHHLLAPALAWSATGAVLVLFARGQGWPLRPLALAGAAALLLILLLALRRTRRTAFTVADAWVRLEVEGRLHSRLTAAAAGVGAWPAYDPALASGLTWRWRRLLAPLALSLACLTAAFAVPIPRRTAAAAPQQEPSSWTQVEQWTETLQAEPLVQPEEVQDLKDQLEALRQLPKEDWYKHSSLEAGDHLRDQLERSLNDLDRSVDAASQTLDAALRASEAALNGQPPDTRTTEALAKEWQKAMEGLRNGSLKLDPALAKQLAQLDPSKLRQLNPEQMKKLQQQLGKCSKACSSCTGKGRGGKPNAYALSKKEGAAAALASCNMPGNGGVSRGRGDAPLTLSDKETQLGTTRSEGVESSDLRDAALGDTLEVRNDKHDIDPARYRGPQAGGAVASAGGSGEAVWRSEVMPDEQRAVERFFKTP